jgi:hypothetical protein
VRFLALITFAVGGPFAGPGGRSILMARRGPRCELGPTIYVFPVKSPPRTQRGSRRFLLQKASNTADQEQTRRTFLVEHFESEIACQNQKNALYIFPLTESTRAGQPGEEKLWLFEPFLITTRARVAKGGRFFYLTRP